MGEKKTGETPGKHQDNTAWKNACETASPAVDGTRHMTTNVPTIGPLRQLPEPHFHGKEAREGPETEEETKKERSLVTPVPGISLNLSPVHRTEQSRAHG